jgi:hypothetical protein
MPTESSFEAITISSGRGSWLRFDDQGIIVKNLFHRTYEIGWAEVHHFSDRFTEWYEAYLPAGALVIVLHDGRTVIAKGTAAEWAPWAPSTTLVVIGQAAQRYGIPADLTGTIERGSFPAALLGASGTIQVTIRDAVWAERILEVIQRTEPVQPGDILTLSHHGTNVEVRAMRQIFAGGRWEQVAYVGEIL